MRQTLRLGLRAAWHTLIDDNLTCRNSLVLQEETEKKIMMHCGGVLRRVGTFIWQVDDTQADLISQHDSDD